VAYIAAPLQQRPTMSATWRAYQSALQSHPLRVNALSAGCIGAAGDSIAQNLEREHSGAPRDLRRTAEMFVFCSTWLGAPQALWFRFLHRVFPDGTAHKLAKTLTVHLGLMAPATNTLFFGYRELLRGPQESFPERYYERMRREFPATTAYSLCFWTPAQTVNFAYVPLHLRPLYLNSMMVVWTTYLSIAGHRRYA